VRGAGRRLGDGRLSVEQAAERVDVVSSSDAIRLLNVCRDSPSVKLSAPREHGPCCGRGSERPSSALVDPGAVGEHVESAAWPESTVVGEYT
jgi:hypothetical protein